MMYYTSQLQTVEPTLHYWGKSHLVMVCSSFYVFLNMVCEYFVEDFFSSIFIRVIGLQRSFLVTSLSGLGLRIILAS